MPTLNSSQWTEWVQKCAHFHVDSHVRPSVSTSQEAAGPLSAVSLLVAGSAPAAQPFEFTVREGETGKDRAGGPFPLDEPSPGLTCSLSLRLHSGVERSASNALPLSHTPAASQAQPLPRDASPQADLLAPAAGPLRCGTQRSQRVAARVRPPPADVHPRPRD